MYFFDALMFSLHEISNRLYGQANNVYKGQHCWVEGGELTPVMLVLAHCSLVGEEIGRVSSWRVGRELVGREWWQVVGSGSQHDLWLWCKEELPFLEEPTKCAVGLPGQDSLIGRQQWWAETIANLYKFFSQPKEWLLIAYRHHLTPTGSEYWLFSSFCTKPFTGTLSSSVYDHIRRLEMGSERSRVTEQVRGTARRWTQLWLRNSHSWTTKHTVSSY